MILALAVRLWALRFQPWVTIDGTDYIRFSEALARGRLYVSPFPPGYPALIALARTVVLDRVVAAAMVSLVAGTLLPWPVWTLARRAVGERWAIAPALAVALHPILIQYSTITMSESAYLLGLYGALALAAAARAGPAGLAIGAGFTIRPEALLPAAALAVREMRGGLPSPALRRLAFAGIGFLLMAVPCWLYFHATLGQWTLSPKLVLIRTASESWQAEEARFLRPAGAQTPPVESGAAKPVHMMRQAPGHALAHGRFVLGMWPAPLLVLSFWGLTRRRGIEAIPLLHLLVLPFVALEQPRFVLSVIPSLAVLATVPLSMVTRRALTSTLGVFATAGMIWCWAANYREVVLPIEGYAGAQKEAGEWLAGAASLNDPVMDRKPHLAFYAGLPYRVMPDAPYDTLLDIAVHRGVRYLVLDEAVVRVFRPQLRPLIYDPALRARERRLELIYAGGHFKGYGLMIFRVLRPGEAHSGRPPRFDVRWRTPGGELPRGVGAK